MEFFLKGKGKIGTSIISFFKLRNIGLKSTDEINSESCGILFVALPDDCVFEYISKIRKINTNIYIIHFSGATNITSEKCYLFHPYASISKESDLSEIFFTLWGKKHPIIESVLKNAGFNFVYAGNSPSPFYHISAVLSGNFTQYFFNAALELLTMYGFSNDDGVRLIKQLIYSSIENCEKSGIKGITGPAVRGDINTIKKETDFLCTMDNDLSKTFYLINNLIFKAVKNGSVFK